MTAAAPTTPAMVPMIVTHDTRSIKRIMSSVEQPGRTLAVNPAPLASRRCAAGRRSAQRPKANSTDRPGLAGLQAASVRDLQLRKIDKKSSVRPGLAGLEAA